MFGVVVRDATAVEVAPAVGEVERVAPAEPEDAHAVLRLLLAQRMAGRCGVGVVKKLHTCYNLLTLQRLPGGMTRRAGNPEPQSYTNKPTDETYRWIIDTFSGYGLRILQIRKDGGEEPLFLRLGDALRRASLR